MKSVLNFCTGELCSEMVSFWRTEIRVWRLSSDYLPLEVFRRLATEKQRCRPRTLPGIAYRFELKGVHPLRTRTKMKSNFEVLLREFVGKKHVSHTIKQFRRYFCAQHVRKSGLINKRFFSSA